MPEAFHALPPLPRRPLVGLAVAALIGTLAGRRWPVPETMPWIMGAGAAAGLLFTLWRRDRAGGPVGAGITLAAVLAIAWTAAATRSALTPQWPAIEGSEAAILTGRVVDEPVTRRLAGNRAVWRFPLRVAAAEVDGQRWPAGMRVEVHWHAGHEVAATPQFGERWRLRGRLREGRPGRGGAGTAVLIAGARASERLPDTAGDAWSRALSALRRRGAAALALGIGDYPDAAGIAQALILGHRERLPARVREIFLRTGTLHVFAISGLHVGIVAGFTVFLLSALNVPRPRWVWVAGPWLIVYVSMTGGQPSAVRACAMAILFLAGAALGRRTDALSTLAAAALWIVIWHPAQVGAPGFTLSFVVVLGMLLMGAPAEAAIRRWGAPDPLLPPGEAPRHAGFYKGARRVMRLAAISATAWLASAPLTIGLFGRVAPVALLANMFVVPAAFLLVLCGGLACAGAVLWEPLAVGFNIVSAAISGVLIAVLAQLARLPGGYIRLSAPTWWPAAVAYPLYGGMLLWWYARPCIDRGSVSDLWQSCFEDTAYDAPPLPAPSACGPDRHGSAGDRTVGG